MLSFGCKRITYHESIQQYSIEDVVGDFQLFETKLNVQKIPKCVFGQAIPWQNK